MGWQAATKAATTQSKTIPPESQNQPTCEARQAYWSSNKDSKMGTDSRGQTKPSIKRVEFPHARLQSVLL